MQSFQRRLTTILSLIMMLTAFAAVSHAATPTTINYQGRLATPSGTPVPDGSYSVVFTIYDASVGGNVLWTESQSVKTSKGQFAVQLGSSTPVTDLAFTSATLYLGVKVGADPEMAPRVHLSTAPYAFRVSTLDGASGGTIGGSIGLNGTLYAELSEGSDAVYATNVGATGDLHYGVTGIAHNGGVQNIGVTGIASDALYSPGNNCAGIYGQSASYYGGTIWAGYFNGWTQVVGNFYATAKFLKIDDPVDPANRTLVHACVESDEFKNIYDGVATTDAAGNATITLPGWFEALNKDFRYQLTVIGQFAQAIVASKIANSAFSIKTDKPNVEVSWQVTGNRKDAYALAHPFNVENDKPLEQRGKYLNPTEQGVSEKLGVDYAMKKMAEEQGIATEKKNK